MIKRTLLFSSSAYLSTRNEQLLIRSEEHPDARPIPIEDIGVLLLEHPEVMLSQSLMVKLLLNNTAVIYCDKAHLPIGLLLPLEAHTLQQERFEAQISASLPLKKQLWQQTIIAKIRNQALLLDQSGKYSAPLWYKVKQVKSDDSSNEEAQAARHYWSEIFEPIQFTRERYGYPPNNLLNYGYAVLRAAVARALVGSGLLPTLGIHHHNRYNAYCLADDIMEPYRPFVDWQVLQLVRNDEYGTYELNKEAKQRLLGILTLDVEINKERSPLMIALSQTSASLARCFEGKTKEIYYPKFVV